MALYRLTHALLMFTQEELFGLQLAATASQQSHRSDADKSERRRLRDVQSAHDASILEDHATTLDLEVERQVAHHIRFRQSRRQNIAEIVAIGDGAGGLGTV